LPLPYPTPTHPPGYQSKGADTGGFFYKIGGQRKGIPFFSNIGKESDPNGENLKKK
jgi:hypothetical protein